MATPEKSCASCGRTFSWRRKWARDWDAVRYCSKRCRGRGSTALDRELEQAIRRLLRDRARDATICPSEAARAVDPTGWRERMEEARAAGRRLAAADEVRVLQRGRPVDPSRARGAIRLGRGPAFPSA